MGGHKFQEAIYSDSHRFILSEAGRRGGKTRANGAKFGRNIYTDLLDGKSDPDASIKRDIPALHYWCVAPDYAICKVQKREVYRWLGDVIQKDELVSKNRIWVYPNILIEFKTGENPNKLVAVGLNGIWVTETARLKPAVWNDNLRPCLSDKNGWLLSDTTPVGRNWYVDEMADLADPTSEKYDTEWMIYFWKTVDNTMIPGLIFEVEKAKKTMPIKYFKRNYEACRDAFQGQIYDEFVFDHHVQTWDVKVDSYKVVVAGQDWGYTHAGVIVVIGITHDDHVDVIAEVSLTKTLVASQDENQRTWCVLAKDLFAKYNIEMIYAGPDQPESIQLEKDSGLPVTAADNNVKLGIQFLTMLLHRDENGVSMFRIHSSCKKTIGSMAQYKWKSLTDGGESEEPLKEKDDEVDALRYGIYSARHWLNIDILKHEVA